ncbi:MAG: SusC/RagA family TonB-linked outer membrane protein [Tannerellaceae bacterium]|nr:SusC/RagA family TonB-linked outer membrane protein [Tannerellaceae bacterium]
MRNIKFKIYLLFAGLFIFMGVTYAQTEPRVNGKVLDSEGQPVAGAIIWQEGKSSVKSVTDEEGNFSFADEFPVGTRLQVEAVGYGNRYYTYQNDTPVIRMAYSDTEVNYGRWIRYNLEESTIASSTVRGEELMKRPGLNPANTLYGKLPGLTVLQNGGYGGFGESDPTLFIRGIGTLNNAGILVLVDGFERPLSSLVTEEIESVTILKDAGALALYGLRGANGVLLVETKKGTAGKMDINVSYEHTFTTAGRFPKMADAATYAEAWNEGLRNEGRPARYSAQEIAAYRSGRYPDFYPDVDWKKEIFRDMGQRDQVNVQASGGTSKVRYFSLINFASDRGLLNHAYDTDSYNTQLSGSTLNIRTNLDIDLTSTTSVELHLLGKLREWNRPGTAGDDQLSRTVYQLPANAFPVKTTSGVWGGGGPAFSANPVALISGTGYAPAHSRGMYADMGLKQDLSMLAKGLSAEMRIGFDATVDYWDGRTKNFLYEVNSARLDEQGNLIHTNTYQYGQDQEELGYYSEVGAQERHSNLVARINYDRAFTDHILNASVMYKQEKNVLRYQFNTFTSQDIITHLHYGYRNRYVVDLALSVSGTSRLPQGDRWGILPAVSAAWNISNESFMQPVAWINLLKLRASYGKTGNSVVLKEYADHPYNSGGNFIFKHDFSTFGGLYELFLPSRYLTYEKTYRTNVGVDARLCDHLSITADAFYNKTTDILVWSGNRTSEVIGVIPPFNSDGKVENYGVELSASYGDKIGDLSYNVGSMFSFSRNKILEMTEMDRPYDYLTRTGGSVRQMYGLEAIGLFKDQTEIDASPQQMFSKVYPGDIKYRDQNGDGKIDELDMVALGYNDLCPEIYYSAFLDLEYKGIGVHALFQGTGNYSTYLNTEGLYKPLIGNTSISEHYLENRWIPGADNNNALYPRLSTTQSENNYRQNSVFITSAAYFKLRTAEVYYKLPAAWIEKCHIKQFKIFARGNDLFSVDRIKVTDPESTGTDYPVLRSYHLGFNMTF